VGGPRQHIEHSSPDDKSTDQSFTINRCWQQPREFIGSLAGPLRLMRRDGRSSSVRRRTTTNAAAAVLLIPMNPVFHSPPSAPRSLARAIFIRRLRNSSRRTPTKHRSAEKRRRKPNTHRRRDSTRQLRRIGVGGVYWA